MSGVTDIALKVRVVAYKVTAPVPQAEPQGVMSLHTENNWLKEQLGQHAAQIVKLNSDLSKSRKDVEKAKSELEDCKKEVELQKKENGVVTGMADLWKRSYEETLLKIQNQEQVEKKCADCESLKQKLAQTDVLFDSAVPVSSKLDILGDLLALFASGPAGGDTEARRSAISDVLAGPSSAGTQAPPKNNESARADPNVASQSDHDQRTSFGAFRRSAGARTTDSGLQREEDWNELDYPADFVSTSAWGPDPPLFPPGPWFREPRPNLGLPRPLLTPGMPPRPPPPAPPRPYGFGPRVGPPPRPFRPPPPYGLGPGPVPARGAAPFPPKVPKGNGKTKKQNAAWKLSSAQERRRRRDEKKKGLSVPAAVKVAAAYGVGLGASGTPVKWIEALDKLQARANADKEVASRSDTTKSGVRVAAQRSVTNRAESVDPIDCGDSNIDTDIVNDAEAVMDEIEAELAVSALAPGSPNTL